MDINDLRIFQVVANHASISKAAKEMSYVQSNVTARIKLLEKELKTPLFDRHKRGVSLNSEGKRLLEYTKTILTAFDEMQRYFHSTSQPAGIMDIGVVETVSIFPALLSQYCSKYPDVDLSIQSGVTNHLIEKVLDGELDGAIVTGPIQHPFIEQHEVIQEELVLVSKSKHFSLEEITQRPMLLYNKGCGYRQKLEGWLKDAGIIPKRIMEFGTFDMILAGVQAGIGLTILPKTAVTHLTDSSVVFCHPVPASYRKITTVFIHRKDIYLTSTIQAFIDMIKQCNSR